MEIKPKRWRRFGDYDVVEQGRQTLTYDDGTVDFVSVRDPKTGLVSQRPIAITPEEELERDIRDLHRALVSVDHRLAHVDDDDHMPWEAPPTDEDKARRRAGLDAEREYVLSKLAELEASAEPKAAPKRKA